MRPMTMEKPPFSLPTSPFISILARSSPDEQRPSRCHVVLFEDVPVKLRRDDGVNLTASMSPFCWDALERTKSGYKEKLAKKSRL